MRCIAAAGQARAVARRRREGAASRRPDRARDRHQAARSRRATACARKTSIRCTHTRLPRYVRGHVGVIERVIGFQVFPDSNAQGLGEDPNGYTPCVSMAPNCSAPDGDPTPKISVDAGSRIWSRASDVKHSDDPGCQARFRERGGPAAARHAEVPSIPHDADGPVFREPWEAQAFAMTLALHERGLFTWPEWAAALADEIKRAQAAGDPDTGETYYAHWLAALEKLVTSKGA